MAYLCVAVYFSGFLVGIPIVAFYSYLQSYLGMRWREWMTGEFLGNYFNNRNYYEIETSGLIDIPDQHIMEDIRSFTRTSLSFLLIILGSLMDLISFTGILWSKSKLLVMVVLVYSVAGTAQTALFGRRLVRLNFNQLRYEADFRYSLVHVRDNTESIALYRADHFALDRMTLMTPDNTRRLIENLSFSLARNDNLVVVGRSGVGKSSLLRAIAAHFWIITTACSNWRAGTTGEYCPSGNTGMRSLRHQPRPLAGRCGTDRDRARTATRGRPTIGWLFGSTAALRPGGIECPGCGYQVPDGSRETPAAGIAPAPACAARRAPPRVDHIPHAP